MGKPDFAKVELTAIQPGVLTAWVDGKVLGAVFTDADGRVCVRLHGECMKDMRRPLSTPQEASAGGAMQVEV